MRQWLTDLDMALILAAAPRCRERKRRRRLRRRPLAFTAFTLPRRFDRSNGSCHCALRTVMCCPTVHVYTSLAKAVAVKACRLMLLALKVRRVRSCLTAVRRAREIKFVTF